MYRAKSCILKIILNVLFLFAIISLKAQPAIYKYGILPVNQKHTYRQSIQKDSLQVLAELQQLMPALVYDLRYASSNNFIHQPVYDPQTRHAFLRLAPARALQRVQAQLQEQGLGLKIFDAYRPYSVTMRFWEKVQDEKYVAHPSKASAHNRGLAVDITIIELATGKEWDMGTGFDHFSDTAHHNFQHLPQAVLKNRRFLKNCMEQHGFTAYEYEWWHYSWSNNRNYLPLDLSFKQLLKVWRKYQ